MAGLLVSLVILRQGTSLLYGAWGDLTDAGISADTRQSLKSAIDPLLSSSSDLRAPSLLAIRHLRGRRAGSLIFVDLTAEVPSTLTVRDAALLEEKIAQTLKAAKRQVTEVRVKFETVD